MARTSTEDVWMDTLKQPFSFTDYEPRGIPGFTSDIAKVLGCSESQTDKLLAAVDAVADEHYFLVERVPITDLRPGSKGKTYPRKYRVTVTPD